MAEHLPVRLAPVFPRRSGSSLSHAMAYKHSACQSLRPTSSLCGQAGAWGRLTRISKTESRSASSPGRSCGKKDAESRNEGIRVERGIFQESPLAGRSEPRRMRTIARPSRFESGHKRRCSDFIARPCCGESFAILSPVMKSWGCSSCRGSTAAWKVRN